MPLNRSSNLPRSLEQLVERLNDALILQQLDGQGQKLCALAKDHRVQITTEDFAAFSEHFAPERATIFAHGMGDITEVSVIAESRCCNRRARQANHETRNRMKGNHR